MAAGLGFPDALRSLPFGGINFSSYPVIQRAALAAGLGFETKSKLDTTFIFDHLGHKSIVGGQVWDKNGVSRQGQKGKYISEDREPKEILQIFKYAISSE